MFIYWIYRIRLAFSEVALGLFPDMQFQIPNYHDMFEEIFSNIGYFLDLNVFGMLFHILLSYQLFRIAVAFYRFRKA